MKDFEMENYFFDTEEVIQNDIKYLVVIIYDISDNKRRIKLSKYLQSFGFRVQKSAFEAIINKKTYNKLINGIPKQITYDDNVKVYKLSGSGEMLSWGITKGAEQEDFIII